LIEAGFCLPRAGEDSPLTAGAAMEIAAVASAHLRFAALLTSTKRPPTQRGK
jgi:hypothetical protein